jgi:hypothetical protein
MKYEIPHMLAGGGGNIVVTHGVSRRGGDGARSDAKQPSLPTHFHLPEESKACLIANSTGA